MDAVAAASAAELRASWASLVRDALRSDYLGDLGRARLQVALERLAGETRDPPDRTLIADLVARGQALFEQRIELQAASAPGSRTVSAMIHGFFADPETLRRLSPSSAKAYRVQARKLNGAFGAQATDKVGPHALKAWYETLGGEVSASTANQALSLAKAVFRWGLRQTPPWILADPTQGLGRPSSRGAASPIRAPSRIRRAPLFSQGRSNGASS